MGGTVCLLMTLCCGCFSNTRYTATLHPAQIKPASHITGRYRVAKVLVKEPAFIKLVRLCAEKGWLGEPDGVNKFVKYSEGQGMDVLQAMTAWQSVEKTDVSELEARHKEDTKMIRDSLNASLMRLYPTIFSNDQGATPLTIMISMNVSYKIDYPSYYPRIAMLFWPLSADIETKYDLWMRIGDVQKDETALWKDFDENLIFKKSWQIVLLKKLMTR